MFNRGVDILLETLPDIEGLPPSELRRMLTTAWLETMDSRLGASGGPDVSLPGKLRRLATALELHAILPPQITMATIRACAFVAAESLMIAEELSPHSDDPFVHPTPFGAARDTERVEAALLYLTAGYDANAALTVQGVEPDQAALPDGEVAAWAMTQILHLLRLISPTDDPVLDD